MQIGRVILTLLLSGMALVAQATTYYYTGQVFIQKTDHTTCTIGTCADYNTTTNKVTGSFTVNAPLAANLALSDISAAVTSYSFNDGINTFTSTDPKARIHYFSLSTDGSGQIVSALIFLEQWQTITPALDGTANSRFNLLEMFFSGGTTSAANILPFHSIVNQQATPNINRSGIDYVWNNVVCYQIAKGPAAASPADTCIVANSISDSSYAAGYAGSWALSLREGYGRQDVLMLVPAINEICNTLNAQIYTNTLRRGAALAICPQPI